MRRVSRMIDGIELEKLRRIACQQPVQEDRVRESEDRRYTFSVAPNFSLFRAPASSPPAVRPVAVDRYRA